MRWRWWNVPVFLLALLVAAIAARVVSRRIWEARIAEVCYAAPEISSSLPLILSNANWKMKQVGLEAFRAYPEPDAIVIREDSVALVWEPPLLNWVPRSMRTGSEGYTLEFSFSPGGKVTSKCHHGSD